MNAVRALVRYVVDRFVTTFLDTWMNVVSASMSIPTKEETGAVARFRTRLQQVGSAGVTTHWRMWLEQLQVELNHRDPRQFLRMPIIRKTMFATNSPYLLKEYNELDTSADWESTWQRATREIPFGHPTPYYKDRGTSGNMIHQAFQLLQFQKKSAGRISDLTHVLEFGGGYGAMCRLVHNLGFAGSYVIYDVPQISGLQEFYLDGAGLRRPGQGASSIALVTDTSSIKQHFPTGSGDHKRMVIALWSLSEAPMESRNEFVDYIRHAEYCLAAFQGVFEGIDNLSFFHSIQSICSDKAWMIEEIGHQPGHYLLIGKPK